MVHSYGSIDTTAAWEKNHDHFQIYNFFKNSII